MFICCLEAGQKCILTLNFRRSLRYLKFSTYCRISTMVPKLGTESQAVISHASEKSITSSVKTVIHHYAY